MHKNTGPRSSGVAVRASKVEKQRERIPHWRLPGCWRLGLVLMRLQDGEEIISGNTHDLSLNHTHHYISWRYLARVTGAGNAYRNGTRAPSDRIYWHLEIDAWESNVAQRIQITSFPPALSTRAVDHGDTLMQRLLENESHKMSSLQNRTDQA